MDENLNPYAPPQANVDGGGAETEYWREGAKAIYVSRGSDLPPRCVKCNAPAVTPIKSRKLYWHHGAVYLLLFVNILIYAVVAMFVRKRIDVSPGLCSTHTTTRNRKILAAWSLFAIGILASWYSASQGGGVGVLIAIAALVGAIVLAVMGSRIVYPVEITADYAHLKGFGQPFLDSIPSRPGGGWRRNSRGR